MANNLTYQYKTANIIVKIIAINVLLYLIVNLMAFLFNISPAYLTQWFVLPSDPGSIIMQPWAILTYGFLHFGFFHLLFNMLYLHWFGKFVLTIFSSKRFLTIYLLGAILGGLSYVLAYNLFPVFADKQAYLIGASGAVTAILIFIATYTPNTTFRIFTFTIKLWQIALVFFLLDLIRLPTSGNAGGLISHIGGAIFGYTYAVQLAKGNDIGKWFENILDWFTNLFITRSQKPFRKVHRNKAQAAPTTKKKMDKSEHQKKVDGILDKIGKSGYESLTKAEKDFLFKAGKEE